MASIKYILIVDDDSAVQKTLKMALERPEWQIDTASSAEEAIALFRNNMYDLVFVDQNLPGMSGIEFIREIRQLTTEVAIFMLTAYGSVESALRTVKLHVDAYIEKPFGDIFEIREMVQNLVQEGIEQKQSRKLARGRMSLGSNVHTAESIKEANQCFENAGKLDSYRDSLPPPGKDLKILIAAIDAKERAWIAEQLDVWNNIVSVSSSQEVVEHLKKWTPDIFVADAELNNPDIFDLISRMKKEMPEVACMVTVSRPSLRVITGLINSGVKAVVEKPLEEKKFRKELTRLIQMSVFQVPLDREDTSI